MPGWSRCSRRLRGFTLLLSLLAASAAVAQDTPAPRAVILEKARFIADHLPGAPARGSELRPDETLLARAAEKYRMAPARHTYEVYLAPTGEDGRPAGGAIFLETPYGEGSLLLGLALSDELRVRRAALMEVSPRYREDFETTTGTGILTRYTMMSARQLGYLASQLKKQGAAGEVVGNGIHHMGAVLATILEQHRP